MYPHENMQTVSRKEMNELLGVPYGGTELMFDSILQRVSQGEALSHICTGHDGMPTREEFYDYMWAREDKRELYEKAKAQRAEVLIEDIITIADDTENDYKLNREGIEVFNGENVQRAKLKVDTRKWVASKLLPKQYGEKITQEVTGSGGAPLVPELSTIELARRVAFMLSRGSMELEAEGEVIDG